MFCAFDYFWFEQSNYDAMDLRLVELEITPFDCVEISLPAVQLNLGRSVCLASPIRRRTIYQNERNNLAEYLDTSCIQVSVQDVFAQYLQVSLVLHDDDIC